MSTLIAHEWIEAAGGSEKVLAAMLAAFPEADVFCLWNDSGSGFMGREVQESWLARTPLRRSKALALPLMPLTWRRLRTRSYDRLIVSSHAFAHHARVPGVSTLEKFVYVHTPARYVWNPELDARGRGIPARAVSATLKPIDRARASEGHHIAANSRFVRDRIRAAWNQDATVIYPPVDVARIQSRDDWVSSLDGHDLEVFRTLPSEFLLGASRFVAYKRLDDVIRAGEVAGIPVVLAGSGPEDNNLRARAARASVRVEFVEQPSEALLYALYQRTLGYVFPPVEDFGIMAVEASAAGSPVLANSVGGAAESVIPGVTGVLTDFRSDNELKVAIDRLLKIDRGAGRIQAKRFSTSRFVREIQEWTA